MLQTLPRKTFLCICLYLCREGERANSTWKFSPAGARGAQGDLETTSTALVVEREPVREERTESSALQNTQSWLDKDKCFFFFLKARNLFNCHNFRSIKRSLAYLMLLGRDRWGLISFGVVCL